MPTLKVYRTYSFQRDPRMVELLELMERHGTDPKALSETTGVGRSTLRNMKNKTRRPLISTLSAAGLGIGYDLGWQKAGEAALFAKRTEKRSMELDEIRKQRAAKKNATRKKKRKVSQ